VSSVILALDCFYRDENNTKKNWSFFFLFNLIKKLKLNKNFNKEKENREKGELAMSLKWR